MIIYPYKQFTPDIHPEAFIADNAVITGDVVIGEQSSIWFSAVIRGGCCADKDRKKSQHTRLELSASKSEPPASY